eukprot:scaffold4233_cov27-Prasinocladus_malaysianus.AAC.2
MSQWICTFASTGHDCSNGHLLFSNVVIACRILYGVTEDLLQWATISLCITGLLHSKATHVPHMLKESAF